MGTRQSAPCAGPADPAACFLCCLVVASLARAASAQSINNGGFEDGLPPDTPSAQWNAAGDFCHWSNPGKAYTGSQYAYFGLAADGVTPLTDASGSIEQTINLPADAVPPTLSFWLWIASDQPATAVRDHLYVKVLDNSDSLI